MPIRAIISDMGGVLLRTEDRAPRAALAHRFGMTYAEIETLVFQSPSAQQATLGQISAKEHWTNVAAALNVSAEEATAVQTEFFRGDRLDTPLLAHLGSRRSQAPLALLSNAFDDLRDWIENQWHIANDFDEIVISAEIGLAKPDRRIYEYTLEKLNVPAVEAVFIDDLPENIEGACAAGLHAIHFTNRTHVIQELDRLLNGTK